MKYPELVSAIGTAALVAAAAALSGCQSNKPPTASAASLPPTPVSVVTVHTEDVPIYQEFAAQTFARDMVEVRGRVAGNVEKRLFQVGSDVRAGDPLYILDLRPYQAAVDKARGDLRQSEANEEFARQQVALLQAEADLAQARANQLKARQDVDRLTPLVKQDAASQQDLDNAMASLRANDANVKAREANVQQIRLSTKAQLDTARAQVASNTALLRTAELNLEYATIKAPISGRIGDSVVQIGGLVNPAAAQPLTTIMPLNPIWVRFKISESEYLDYKKRQAAGGATAANNMPLQLVLADGTIHTESGRIQNAVNQVDARTGTLELQATFPNPQGTLLPGQFGRVRVNVEDRRNAILVPQRAVTEMQGLQSVMTVGPDSKAQVRGVSTGERVGERWIIQQGLKDGDQVIVEGLQKARPGAPVKAEPFVPRDKAEKAPVK
ncbi:MAG TPA: efflux RND transporter periplasmic adaptor subunit [Bryobacteraceae bacterium]|nr:efflux RND transporter periplasmic adaptor subunit [Bryobacteraceae bacterium]